MEREKDKHVKHGNKADTPIHVSNTSENKKGKSDEAVGKSEKHKHVVNKTTEGTSISKKTDEYVEKIDKSKKTSKLATWVGASNEKFLKRIDTIKKKLK
jgi:hypothetical protein